MLAFCVLIDNDSCMSMEGFPEDSTLLGIHEAFMATEYGDELAAHVRYGKYKPTEVSNERWEELLGPDVNSLNHLVDTLHVTKGFIRHTDRLQPGLLTRHDKAVLQVAAIGHDWGESIIPDVNYFEKTTAHTLAEEEVFAANLANFYPLDDPEVMSLITEAAETVIFDHESRLGEMFSLIERIGYVRTGLCADRHVREGSAPDCEENLRWLAAAVLCTDHVEQFITKGQRLFAAHDFVILREEDITAAYEAADPAIFYRHEPLRDAAARGQDLEKAKFAWEIWRAGLHSAAR